MRESEFTTESAVKELADQLPTLKRTDYAAIDRLMKRIGIKHSLSSKKLHHLFVSKYGHSPDHWVKQIKQRNEANEHDRSIPWVDRNSELDDMLDALAAEFEELYEPTEDDRVDEGMETPEYKQQIKDFIQWSYAKLNMQQPHPKFKFSTDTQEAQADHRTGVHDDQGNITIYVKNRNLVDIMRTIFHELVHHRQDQLGMIKHGDSYPGSPIEAMADMMAGKYMKIYGKQHPEIFQ